MALPEIFTGKSATSIHGAARGTTVPQGNSPRETGRSPAASTWACINDEFLPKRPGWLTGNKRTGTDEPAVATGGELISTILNVPMPSPVLLSANEAVAGLPTLTCAVSEPGFARNCGDLSVKFCSVISLLLTVTVFFAEA